MYKCATWRQSLIPPSPAAPHPPAVARPSACSSAVRIRVAFSLRTFLGRVPFLRLLRLLWRGALLPPPLGASVLEPNLRVNLKKKSLVIIFSSSISLFYHCGCFFIITVQSSFLLLLQMWEDEIIKAFKFISHTASFKNRIFGSYFRGQFSAVLLDLSWVWRQ